MTHDVAHALLVDLYELTMVDAYRREGMAARPATFSLFVRALPPGRGYLVAAGLDDALRWLGDLHFGSDELAALERLGVFDASFLDWLGGLRFRGAVRAVPEGTVVFPHEPLLEVDAPIAEAQLAETFLLNQVTLQTTLATKAARCRHASAGRAVVDFALRRTHGIDAGMKLARVCGLVGLAGTSNVAGADRYGLPASGTMAHSFVQAHHDEADAFRAFARALGPATVLLVDTYDTHRGIEHAVEVAAECRRRGVEIRGIRLDSGDLAALARHARGRLDDAGFGDAKVLASGGLDEHEIHRLLDKEEAPIDGFGVGSSLAVSDDAPVLDSVYKLVAYDGRPVRKTSTGKEIWPGAKQVWRAPDWSHDTLTLADEPAPEADARSLLVEVMHDGQRTEAGERTLAAANRRFEHEWAGVPTPLQDLDAPPEHPLAVSDRLRQLAADLDRERESSGDA
ncbi:MAG TPA: nicotinate phosphoribosyltransferase [Acidimicrobiales bacterium]|nr:nicotinate phosphoribosyltransferase [Acidimicrobiales bacterium]